MGLSYPGLAGLAIGSLHDSIMPFGVFLFLFAYVGFSFGFFRFPVTFSFFRHCFFLVVLLSILNPEFIYKSRERKARLAAEP